MSVSISSYLCQAGVACFCFYPYSGKGALLERGYKRKRAIPARTDTNRYEQIKQHQNVERSVRELRSLSIRAEQIPRVCFCQFVSVSGWSRFFRLVSGQRQGCNPRADTNGNELFLLEPIRTDKNRSSNIKMLNILFASCDLCRLARSRSPVSASISLYLCQAGVACFGSYPNGTTLRAQQAGYEQKGRLLTDTGTNRRE